ncbi:hypothetical protein N473_19475 [Pseudoalteromonas luteoviolacea CPMOR-1]|uniref:Uncharacterized protein n=1 Tax=Pseudoalteromonas luteoviolacea CPMOR-1 TaxID=1365248 RepID=A0A161YLT0_9GAMM|nr:hypothetical protein [Pseudoalteromonas luteoviolacea]KZN62436.1 hypothetical protein N473_19475 [Pseudoalteromonas luteoviolacea CPMOR-1]
MSVKLKKMKVKNLSQSSNMIAPQLTKEIAGGTSSNPWYTNPNYGCKVRPEQQIN